jgi:hypothetical protein
MLTLQLKVVACVVSATEPPEGFARYEETHSRNMARCLAKGSKTARGGNENTNAFGHHNTRLECVKPTRLSL